MLVVDPAGVAGRRFPDGVCGECGGWRHRAVHGLLIGLVFGLVFVEVNSGDLPDNWSFGLRAAGAVIALILLVGLLWRRRSLGQAERTGDVFNRRYRAVVAVEVVALVVGLMIIKQLLEADRFTVAWVAVVVGVHFFGLGAVWHHRSLYLVGMVLTLLGLAGFVLGAAGGSAAAIALVSGVGCGATLFLGVGLALLCSPALVNR